MEKDKKDYTDFLVLSVIISIFATNKLLIIKIKRNGSFNYSYPADFPEDVLDEMANNALSQIGVQLTSRWDAVTALVKLTKDYARHEHDTLVEAIEKRRMTNPTTAQQINDQFSATSEILGRLIAVSERYPELKASEVYRDTMASLQKYEENVRMSRMVYNDSATKMNRIVRQWPSSIVASILHFGKREYLQTEEKKQEYPDIDAALKS